MHLLDRVFNSVFWMGKKPDRNHVRFEVYLLFPQSEDDYWKPFIIRYNKANNTILKYVSGDMDNVFSRYERLYDASRPNYLVRLTGDCPMIPSPLLSKMINIATKHRLDYTSNVDERFRTMPDGYDVEIMSDKAFEWLMINIERGNMTDKEHVTTYLRSNHPEWMRVAHFSSNVDHSDFKISVDTKQDFDFVKSRYNAKFNKDNMALEKGYGVYEY